MVCSGMDLIHLDSRRHTSATTLNLVDRHKANRIDFPKAYSEDA